MLHPRSGVVVGARMALSRTSAGAAIERQVHPGGSAKSIPPADVALAELPDHRGHVDP
jgi:hypothetical protein